jgi:hypothetical protein
VYGKTRNVKPPSIGGVQEEAYGGSEKGEPIRNKLSGNDSGDVVARAGEVKRLEEQKKTRLNGKLIGARFV